MSAPPPPQDSLTAAPNRPAAVPDDTTPATDPAPRYAIGAGTALILVGAVGYLLSEAENPVTALIPAGVGLLLIVCGVIAMSGERALKHAMHAAALIGVLGFLAGAGRLAMVLATQDDPSPLGVVALAAMAVICGVFVALCVKSFIDARKRREAAARE